MLPVSQSNLTQDILQIIRKAQQKTVTAINFAMVEAYWLIGKRIVEEEQKGEARAYYGKGIVKALAKQLTEEVGKGFSEANLWNFRQFFLCFPTDEKLYTLCRELSWSHYTVCWTTVNNSLLPSIA